MTEESVRHQIKKKKKSKKEIITYIYSKLQGIAIKPKHVNVYKSTTSFYLIIIIFLPTFKYHTYNNIKYNPPNTIYKNLSLS